MKTALSKDATTNTGPLSLLTGHKTAQTLKLVVS